MPSSTEDQDRRRELADFLRTRRARIQPTGGRAAHRRRTPGLRREEVAELAGVSASWYTWLEQGRPVRPSPEFLARLGQVFQLKPFEVSHLFELAGRTPPNELGANREKIPEALEQLVKEVLGIPAFIMGECFEFLLWNRHFTRQIFDASRVPEERRTVLDMMFTESITQRVRPQWEEDARRTVAEFRWSVGKKTGSPRVKSLIARMSHESPEFAQFWQLHDIQERKSSRAVELQTEGKRQHFIRSIYVPAEADHLRLVILTPIEGQWKANKNVE